MKGNIYRVTYNVNKQVAELHMVDGSIKEVSMTNEDWNNAIQGNVIDNFSKFLDE